MEQKGIVFQSDVHEKIIKLVAEYGYITSSEVKLLISSDENPVPDKTSLEQKAQNILYYMSKRKIIASFQTHLSPAYAYTLTPSTKTIIIQSGLVEFIRPFIISRYKPITFYHDTAMLKMHIIFEEILGDMLKRHLSSYRLAKQQTKKICDAEIYYTGHNPADNKPLNKVAAMEIELTAKSKNLLLNTAKDLLLQAKNKYNSVIIIYTSTGIKQNWQNTLKQMEFFSPPYFFFIQYLDVIRNKKNCKAYDINDNIIPLFNPEEQKC
ncbi:MAG: hypothetical protein M1409_01315 [Actinobacteria bacterium]|nr:hypothetical protein [Actinomycetota bacterium]MCL5408690.1 hypothetical protein [Candidatus Omnitrophota bacterium]